MTDVTLTGGQPQTLLPNTDALGVDNTLKIVNTDSTDSKILDILTSAAPTDKNYIDAVLDGGTSSENPVLPPPDPDINQAEQDQAFQDWMSKTNADKMPNTGDPAADLDAVLQAVADSLTSGGDVQAATEDSSDLKDIVDKFFNGGEEAAPKEGATTGEAKGNAGTGNSLTGENNLITDLGEGEASAGVAVDGDASAGTGVAVDGDASAGTGVAADGDASAGTGVAADGDASAGTGVAADGDASAGTGVASDGDASAGTGVAVDGDASAGTGVALDGDASAGTGVAVDGEAAPSGTATTTSAGDATTVSTSGPTVIVDLTGELDQSGPLAVTTSSTDTDITLDDNGAQLPAAVAALYRNSLNQLGDVETGIKDIMSALKLDGTLTDPNSIKMRDFLQTVLDALNKLKELTREIAMGNSQQARESSLAKMKDSITQIKEQVRQMEAAEKAAKKQKTLGLVMKILAPIMMLAMVIATVVSGGLAGPLMALTIAMFVVSVADQIVAQSSGQGMFARMFDAMSQTLPAGVALFLKVLVLSAVIIGAVMAPANGAIAMGLAFSMVSSAGLQKDVGAIARDHNASENTVNIINWTMTGVIAVVGIAATAGRGFSQLNKVSSSEVADNVSEFAARLGPSKAPMQGYGNVSGMGVQSANAKPTSFFDNIKTFALGAGAKAGDNGGDGMPVQLQRVGVAMQVGNQGAQMATGVLTGVGSIKQANWIKENADKEALLTLLQQNIKALQAIVDGFLSGQMNFLEFAEAINKQLDKLFSGLSGMMSDIARTTMQRT